MSEVLSAADKTTDDTSTSQESIDLFLRKRSSYNLQVLNKQNAKYFIQRFNVYKYNLMFSRQVYATQFFMN